MSKNNRGRGRSQFIRLARYRQGFYRGRRTADGKSNRFSVKKKRYNLLALFFINLVSLIQLASISKVALTNPSYTNSMRTESNLLGL